MVPKINIGNPLTGISEIRYSIGMDWKQLIADIVRDAKLTQPQIAKHCECAQATISDLATGVTENPRYPLGQSLLALHAARHTIAATKEAA